MKKIDETRNYFIEEINQNELISKKHKNVCKTLNYVEQLLILDSTLTKCVLITNFASLVGITIDRYCKLCSRIKYLCLLINSF